MKFDLKKLKYLESLFFNEYSEGFNHLEILVIGKKHKMGKLTAFASESLQKDCFDDDELVISMILKLVSQSTFVSMFEKTKFRDFIQSIEIKTRQKIVQGL